MHAGVDVDVVRSVRVHLRVLKGGETRRTVTAVGFAAVQLGKGAADRDQDGVLGDEQVQEVEQTPAAAQG